MPYGFLNYIQRSLETDFKTVVEISPVIWFVTVLFLLTNSNGLHSYLWLPFIPLIVVLIVGTKLQVIITKLGLRILEKGDVVRGCPLVQPGDDLFWFDNPGVMLFLIQLVLFTNAFQLAFFAWSSYEFGFSNCFHKRPQDIAIRIFVGLVVQILCSYVTLPLYALVIQMGTRMKPTVFNQRVAKMLKKWHHTAHKETQQQGRHSESNTPTHGSSLIHLLHNSNNHHQFYDPESQHQVAESSTHRSAEHESASIELSPIRPAKA
ncbi:unnamed protein product [Eruca vesicaria subsp. sativa]|uniref:MLO-like protein n=1 Tax=Eruca vesicaria subsp. sativa TaxID=29727 RepID=A0ABC8KSC9_ERUVS|nr:unnamed protein product [Eruca vesicaria subsp. sativa]